MTLDEWQKAALPALSASEFGRSRIDNVTLLAYFFWDDDRIESKFYTIEFTFLAAFRNLGLMKSELVVNRTTPRMVDFCARYGIHIQVDETLTGGVPTMNLDCLKNLHRRFDTEYVLIIQSDGIIVNPGLERFVGKFDCIGATWPGTMMGWWDVFPYPRFSVGNGGLTLRSKRICEKASEFYRRHFAWMPYNPFLIDDVFYCKTMGMFNRLKGFRFRYCDPKTANEFAVEFPTDYLPPPDNPPMGFHAKFGFDLYMKHWGVPMKELLQP